MNNWIYIAVMFAVSYAIRILPLTLIRKPIENQLIQSMSETEVIGPIQMGLNKPIHFTDCEASVRDIVNITAVAVIDAIVDKKKKEK